MVSETQSFVNILIAAGACTAMAGVGLLSGGRDVAGRRRVRPLWLVGSAVGAILTCYAASIEARGYRANLSGLYVVLAAAVGLVGAVVLIVVGLRGRRVGDHPYCRQCGFDLFGTPATTGLCNECGASLLAPRAVVVGVHHRRAEMLLAGVFVLVASMAGATMFGRDAVVWAQAYEWRRHWPDGWLVRDLTGTPNTPRSRVLAIGELRRRIRENSIGSTALAALIDDALTGRTVVVVLPPREAAVILLDRWSRGDIGEDVVRRAMRAALAFDVHAAPVAARGATFRYVIVPARPAATGILDIVLAVENRADTIAGLPMARPTRSALEPLAGAATFGDGYSLVPLADALPLGPAAFESKLTLVGTLATPGRPVLVERVDVTLRGNTTIVADAAAMRCPPITYGTVGRGRSTVVASPSTPMPPRVALVRRAGGRGGAFHFANQAGGALLADVTLVDGAGATQRLGTLFLPAGSARPLPIDDVPAGAYELRLEPAPERGVELFQAIPTYQVPVVVPSSHVRVEGGVP